MLKKGFRLRKKEDFDRVFRSGKPLFFEEIACRFALNGLPSLRLGFSFSKKHIPLAVDRNRMRRVLSEAFAAMEDEWPKGVDIIFFSIKKPKKIDSEALQPLVSKAIKYITKSQ